VNKSLMSGTVGIIAILLLAGCATPIQTPRLAELDEMIAAHPERSGGYHNRGFTYAMLGQSRAAERDFAKAFTFATHPAEIAQIHWSYGWALLNLKSYAKALDQWKLSVAISDPQPAWAPYTLALGYWVNGRIEEALSYYDEAAKAMPERFSTREGLVRYTSAWTWHETQHMYRLHDAWRRGYVRRTPTPAVSTRRARAEAQQQRPSMAARESQLNEEALERHLQEYQMEVIRQGIPPLPIPLTPGR
jgi:tetratricopeptide (TPR) repeat protein